MGGPVCVCAFHLRCFRFRFRRSVVTSAKGFPVIRHHGGCSSCFTCLRWKMTSKQTASPKKAGSRSLLHERDTDVVASMLEKILAGNQVVAARLERVESILEQGGRGGGLVASSKQTRVLKIEDIMSKTHKDLTKAPKMSSALVPNIAGQPQQKRSLKGLLAKAAQSNAKQARVHPDGAVLEEHSPAPMAPRSSKFHHSADGLDSDLVRAQHELEVITDAKSCLATEASSLHGELQPREFLVIPQNAHPKQLWDLTMLVLAIITCVLTPIQIGFPIAGLESGSFLMYSAVVDVMFLIDVLLGFVTSFTVGVLPSPPPTNCAPYLLPYPPCFRNSRVIISRSHRSIRAMTLRCSN